MSRSCAHIHLCPPIARIVSRDLLDVHVCDATCIPPAIVYKCLESPDVINQPSFHASHRERHVATQRHARSKTND
jgi:hypothetical protein